MQEVQPRGFRISMKVLLTLVPTPLQLQSRTMNCLCLSQSLLVIPMLSTITSFKVWQMSKMVIPPAIHFGIVCEGTVEFAGQLFSRMCFDWHADVNFLTVGNREYSWKRCAA
jgi:hypothetical protein